MNQNLVALYVFCSSSLIEEFKGSP